MPPSFDDANALARACAMLPRAVAGVDEVGRGPLAGPVCAGAVMLDAAALDPALLAAIDDSKRLSATRRTAVASALAGSPAAHAALGWACVDEVAALNVLGAALLAMRRAVSALAQKAQAAVVDGNRDPQLGMPTRLIVKGDARSVQIAAASIVAKAARDAEMARLDALFPGYGWAANAGYPTQAHRAALARLGPTPHHRRGFKGVP